MPLYISSSVTTGRKTTRRTLLWRHNVRDGVSNHQSHDCLLNRLFRRRSKKTSELRVTGLCVKWHHQTTFWRSYFRNLDPQQSFSYEDAFECVACHERSFFSSEQWIWGMDNYINIKICDAINNSCLPSTLTIFTHIYKPRLLQSSTNQVWFPNALPSNLLYKTINLL